MSETKSSESPRLDVQGDNQASSQRSSYPEMSEITTATENSGELPAGGEQSNSTELSAPADVLTDNARKQEVDLSVPQEAPGLLRPAEAPKPAKETSGETAARDSTDEEDGKGEVTGSREDNEGGSDRSASSQESGQKGKAATEDRVKRSTGGNESGEEDEENESDANAFDDSLDEEEGGRAPIMTLPRGRRADKRAAGR